MTQDTSTTNRLTRRQLAGVVAGVAVGPAGCLGFLGDDGEDNGDDGEANGDDSDDTTDGTGAETPTPEPTPSPEESPALGERRLFPDSFAMEATVPMVGFGEPGEPTSFTGRVTDGDIFVAIDGPTDLEWYFVGEQGYSVEEETDGERRCTINPRDEVDRRAEVDPTIFEDVAAANAALEPTATEIVDGERLDIYEVSGADADGFDGRIRLSVAEETGYLHHVETPESTWEFHSFGDVEPIEAPERDCQELGE